MTTRLARTFAIGIALASIALSITLVSLLTAAHLPYAGPGREASALASLQPSAIGWRTFHVLYSGCRCSRQISTHLIERRPVSNRQELVLVVGEDTELIRDLTAGGFAVRSLGEQEAAERYGLNAAPWLVILSPEGKVAYSGGYSDRPVSGSIQEEQIWQRLTRGERVDPLPAYGCALSTKLRRRLNPLASIVPDGNALPSKEAQRRLAQ